MGKLYEKSGVYLKAAQKVAQAIGNIDLYNGTDPLREIKITDHGESRIKHCIKRDLGHGCRLITIIDNNMMSASPIEGKSASYFLYSMLSTIDFNTLVSGTALPYLNVSDLRKIPIVRPLDGVCRAFELKAASIFLMMQKLAAQSVTLASVRDALLPKLLSGEIEVSGLDEG